MSRSNILLLVAGLAVLWLIGVTKAQDHGAPPPSPAAQPGHAAEPGQAAGDSHAAGHEEVGVIPNVKQGTIVAISSVVVFAIVFAVLATTVWPKIVKGLNDREAKIREEIESAERARQQARDALEQYQKSLAEARAEAQRMLEQTKASQQALAAELKAKADAELVQMKDRARRDIDAAKRAALAEIYAAAGDLATTAASKILRREVQPGDSRRLIEESLGELQTAKA